MAKHILMPLDIDDTAQDVAPLIAGIARASGGSVRLLHVAPVPEERRGEYGRIIAYADQEMARLEAEAIDGLRAAEARLAGVPVEIVVRFGDPAEEIVREAEAFDADLIALTTGRTSRLRWALGRGVAERVFREAPAPVLLLRDGSTLPSAV
jgi:nucleotide-binding universal stress UspA family protein